MTLIAIVLGAGIMAAISAFMLFKLRDLDDKDGGFKLASSLQALFFFMIIANFILMGSAGYESRNDCSYLMSNSTIVADVTSYEYEYSCTARLESGSSWIYRLPVWLAYFSASYVAIYLIVLLFNIFKGFTKGGDYGK